MYAFSSLFFKNGQNFQMFDWEAVTLRTKIIELKSASYSGGFPYQEGRFFWFQVKPRKVVPPICWTKTDHSQDRSSNQVWVNEGNA